MKTKFTMKQVLLLPAFAAILFVSCSKSKTDIAENGSTSSIQAEKKQTSRNFINSAALVDSAAIVDTATADPGAITLTIVPAEAMPTITIYNSTFSSDSFDLDKTGFAVLKGIPPGTYSVKIEPSIYGPRNNYNTVQIDNVTITADSVTDLGEIDL